MKNDKLLYGISSRIPLSLSIKIFGQPNHYLILDFDYKIDHPIIQRAIRILNDVGFQAKTIVSPSPNGVHVYSDLMASFDQIHNWMKFFKADYKWIKIGEKRGYWFLRSYYKLKLPWEVEYMRLTRKDGEKT